MVSAGVVSLGGGAAILVDVSTKGQGERLAEIPTSLGDGIGGALKKEYGWTYAPVALGVTESVAMGSFKVDKAVDLVGFSLSAISTAQSVGEAAHDFNHPQAPTVKAPLIYQGTSAKILPPGNGAAKQGYVQPVPGNF